MADPTLPKPDREMFDRFLRAEAEKLRAGDKPPADLKSWNARRQRLRTALFAAMGTRPEKATPLEAKVLATLPRQGYRIETVLFQSRPDVWVTANAYIPDPIKGKIPAVLCVHGHFSLARRDPVIQARCLGLVKLGFFVLAIDAFGAGERYSKPAPGSYHGALYGSTLWPAGETLLGMQVHDNQRAVDYLCSRPEVNPTRLGITGASGGGNQTMYAGALDERLQAVVPVCSVGNYQAYLHAACCVCEVLPGALRFTEEGEVLGLVAPRALMVINAARDGIQFSIREATKSVDRARAIFQLHKASERIVHPTFDTTHGYHRPMREAMYGWMVRWLKGEGEGKPIAEPKHEVEKPETLACFPDGTRPKGFLFPATYAQRTGQALLMPFTRIKPDHAEDWESTAVAMRTRLRKDVLGDLPALDEPLAELGSATETDGVRTTPLTLRSEKTLALPALLLGKRGEKGRVPACVLLHLEGKDQARKQPLVKTLLDQGWVVVLPDLRGTGSTQREHDRIGGAPDHTSAEHALWIGRPLLGQWVVDVMALLDWMALQPGLERRRFTVLGVGQAGLVALCAGALLDDRVMSTVLVDTPISYLTSEPYAEGTWMGTLAPGILRVGDVPHLAALSAPRKLQIVRGVTSTGQKVHLKDLQKSYAFPTTIFKMARTPTHLLLTDEVRPESL